MNDHILHTHIYIYVYIYIYPNIYLRAWFVYQRMASVSFMGFPKISAGCFTLRWRGGFGHRDSQVPKASWLDMSLGLCLNSTCHFLEKNHCFPAAKVTRFAERFRVSSLPQSLGGYAWKILPSFFHLVMQQKSGFLSQSGGVTTPHSLHKWVENRMFFFSLP